MVKSIAAAVVVIAAGLGAGAAQAGNVSWSIGIDVPFYVPVYAPVYAPVPVYMPEPDFYAREPIYLQGPPVYRAETPGGYYPYNPNYGHFSHHPRTRVYDGPHRVVYDYEERGWGRQWHRPDQHRERGADAWRGRDDRGDHSGRAERGRRGERREWQRD